MKNIFIPGAVLYVSCFQPSIVFANFAKTLCTLRKGVNLGTITFFPTSSLPVKINSLASPITSLFTIFSVQFNSITKLFAVDFIIHELVHHITSSDKTEIFIFDLPSA